MYRILIIALIIIFMHPFSYNHANALIKDGYDAADNKIHMVGGNNIDKPYEGFILNKYEKAEDSFLLNGYYNAAFLLYSKKANEGDIYAAHNLGLMYLRGLGVEKDILNALKFLEISMQKLENLNTANVYYLKALKEKSERKEDKKKTEVSQDAVLGTGEVSNEIDKNESKRLSCPTNGARHDCIGTFKFSDGSIYSGQWKDGMPNGQGKLTLINGEQYNGLFKDNMKDGQGIYLFSDGSKYEGTWRANLKNGQGKIQYSNGSVYVGQFIDDKRNGQGTLTFLDARKFSGWWKDDTFISGQLTYPDGSRYEGSFSNEMRNGAGKFWFSSGDFFLGYFKDDDFNGRMQVIYNNGDTFDGKYEYNKREGQGVYKWKDGSKFEGLWRLGLPTKEGTQTGSNGNILVNVNYKSNADYSFSGTMTVPDTLTYSTDTQQEDLSSNKISPDLKSASSSLKGETIQSSPLPLTPTISVWNHNGSTVRLEANGSTRKFYYESPRNGLPVLKGDLLFEGFRSGERYQGTAFVFSRKCGRFPYPVSGKVQSDDRLILLEGMAPKVDENCDIVQSVKDNLRFDYETTLSARPLAGAPRLPNNSLPFVSLLSAGDNGNFSGHTVEVRYSVRSPSGAPIDRVDALIDGRPADMRGLTIVDKSVPVDANAIRTFSIPAPQRDFELSLIAYSNGMASEAAKTRMTFKGVVATTEADLLKPKLYVLAIGISDYKDETLKLKFASKDALDFAQVWSSQKGGLYTDVTVKTLLDKDATRDTILDALEWLEKQVTAKDFGIVFFAGHGINDQANRFWVLPSDGTFETVRKRGVSKDELLSTMTKLPGKAILFLDACHSAAVGTNVAMRSAVDINKVVNEFSSAENGIVIFTSSTGRELSMESSDWGNGAFTKALVEGIGSGKADLLKKGRITLSGLYAYVTDRVKEITEGRQHPVFNKPDTVQDYPIAVVR